MVTWDRSFDDKSHDFTAYDGSLTVGRTYRHWDGKRWQRFFQQVPGKSGIEDSKQEAADAILQAYENWNSRGINGQTDTISK